MPCTSAWSHAEVPDFIALWRGECAQAHLNSSHCCAQTYKQLFEQMNERKFHQDSNQYQMKGKELRLGCKSVKDNNRTSWRAHRVCNYCEALDHVFWSDPATKPFYFVDSTN